VEARAYLVENGATGEILAARAADRRVPIASITKLMTVLVALERARPNDVVTVSSGSAGVGESTVNLRAGERLRVRDLVAAALIQSANDAAVALADHVGRGDRARFVALMNARARALGLTDTHFVRPDGLDVPGHVSSARDVTLLARVAMRKPLVRQLVVQRRAAFPGGRVLHTWNDLLGSFPGLIGVKTGHTSAAGWSQVAAARRGATTVYATILGSASRSVRNADLAELLRYGLSRYRTVPLVLPGRSYGRVRVGYGRAPVRAVAPRPVWRVVRADRALVERVIVAAAADLPLVRGRKVGEVRVYQQGRLLARSPLVAARTVQRPGFFGRVGWYAGRTAHNVAGWFS